MIIEKQIHSRKLSFEYIEMSFVSLSETMLNFVDGERAK